MAAFDNFSERYFEEKSVELKYELTLRELGKKGYRTDAQVERIQDIVDEGTRRMPVEQKKELAEKKKWADVIGEELQLTVDGRSGEADPGRSVVRDGPPCRTRQPRRDQRPNR